MTLLQFWPLQPHHKLQADGRTLTAGETFEASDEDAEDLLNNPHIELREAPKTEDTEIHAQPPSGTAVANNLMGDPHAG